MRTGAVSSGRSSLSTTSRRRAMRRLFPNWEKRSSWTRRFCAGCSTRLRGSLAGRDVARPRQLDAHQKAFGVINELDIAAMAYHDVARDGEAKAGAAGFAVA